ncbi:MAG: hypothetical protein ACREH8_18695 [Opitutaceae bacterium]
MTFRSTSVETKTRTSPAAGRWTRRKFLTTTVLGLGAAQLHAQPKRVNPPAHPVIDIHQHTSFRAQEDKDLFDHQERLGVSKTILLPAGRMNGLAAGASGNMHSFRIAEAHPKSFATFASDVVHLPGAIREIEFYLKRGAIGIGELKDNVECDSSHLQRVFVSSNHNHRRAPRYEYRYAERTPLVEFPAEHDALYRKAFAACVALTHERMG